MKRCPQCSFVHLDTDDRCDLDGTILVHADDSEIDSVSGANQGTPVVAQRKETAVLKPERSRKALAVAAIALLVLGVILFVAYGVNRKNQQAIRVNEKISQEPLSTPSLGPQQTPSTPTPEESPRLNTSSSPTLRSTPSSYPHATREAMSLNPVSTGTNGDDRIGPVFIRLTNGVRIEADEVWQTKEGFWYRRNGIVTLIKANRVKVLEKAKRKP